MSPSPLKIAEVYYKAMGEKNAEAVEKYLHPDIQFITPLVKLTGKENVLGAAKKFTTMFKELKIRSLFGSENQAMVVYDLEDLVGPAPIGSFSSASLMTFRDGLILKIELFYDARPFEIKK